MAQLPPRQNQISDLPNLTDYNFENIFNIYQEKGHYFYNLLNTINFPEQSKLRPELYSEYTIHANDIWSTISYKLYGSISIWWILCILNRIENPLVMPPPGTKIIVFTVEAINQVLQTMNS